MELLLVALLGLGVTSGFEYDGHRVTFGPLDNIDEYYFKIPRTTEGAENMGWYKTERAPGPLKQLTAYCSPGRHVCPLYAPSGYISGLQLAFPEQDLFAAAIDIRRWFTKWNAPATESEPAAVYWTISHYYVSEEMLENDNGPQACNGSTLQDAGVWVRDHSGELMLIPRSEEDIKSKTPFTKQNCTPRMGTHYHYNMTKEMLCENQLPWFALTMQGQLIGCGLQFFGDLAHPTLYREWFEKFHGSDVERSAVPFGPDCLYNFADNYPIFSLHVWFIDNPGDIKCRKEDSADPSTLLG